MHMSQFWKPFPFMDLDIKKGDSIFVYKLFDKRDSFPFFTCQAHMSSNVLFIISYGSTFS